MNRKRAGLVVDGERLTVVALSTQGQVVHFSLEPTESLAAALKGELDARKIRTRGFRVGLDRALVTVKPLDLPRGSARDLGQMVRFECERHVPFVPDEMCFDWAPLPSHRKGPLRLLATACERRTTEQALRLLAEAGRRPLSLTVACHELRRLLPRRIEQRRAVWAHRHQGRTDLLFLGRGRLRLSRQVLAEHGEELAHEISRTLALVHWTDCDAVWISGDDVEPFLTSAEVAELAPTVSTPPYRRAVVPLVKTLPKDDYGSALLALGVAVGSRRPSLNLLPRHLRPWSLSRAQWSTVGTAAAVAVLGIALLLGQAHQRERYLSRLSQEIRRLDPEVKAVERLAADLTQKQRVLAALQSAREGSLKPLPVLQALTEIVPADAWLQAVTMDRQGVELTGQAAVASQLVPALEASPWLERVELTAPVTKAQGKEQFRLKGAWERPPRPAPSPSGGEGSKR